MCQTRQWNMTNKEKERKNNPKKPAKKRETDSIRTPWPMLCNPLLGAQVVESSFFFSSTSCPPSLNFLSQPRWPLGQHDTRAMPSAPFNRRSGFFKRRLALSPYSFCFLDYASSTFFSLLLQFCSFSVVSRDRPLVHYYFDHTGTSLNTAKHKEISQSGGYPSPPLTPCI